MSKRRIWPAIAAIAIVLLLAAIAVAALGGNVVPPATAGPVPVFVDETAASGLTFTYDGPFAYAVGGGVAVFDCDDDGFPDVYLAGGERPAALFRNTSAMGGELRFERAATSGAELDRVNGAYPLDVDGDGHPDLVTLRNGENVALRGLGECRFERANEAWNLDGGAELTEAFSATWEAGADWPTMAFGNYAEPGSLDPETWCQTSELVRPDGRRFGEPIPLEPGFCALSMLFSDWDGSGRKDLRVSNDRQYYRPDDGQEQLWRVAPGEAPRLYGVDDGWARVQVQGMGIASQDLTGDGLPEVYLTSQSASKLQTLAAGPAQPGYRDIGLARGVNVAHPFTGDDVDLPSTAWHPEFDDANNDGLVDLFVSKGNVTSQPDYAIKDPSNLLLGQPDGTFREAADSAGILSFDRGRGAALTDFNLDGRLDLLEVNYGAPVRIWANTKPADASAAARAHWLALRLVQPGINPDGIGAWIEVTAGGATIRRELTVGGGHAGGQLGWIHFGLGAADGADVRVRWPDGQVGPSMHVAADGFAIVDREANLIKPGAAPPR
jgi:hypothetical protein